jgi:protein-tyrosine phosphatase
LAGKSRSPSFILAYLIKYQKMNLDDALVMIQEVYPKAQPNEGFYRQLRDYEINSKS